MIKINLSLLDEPIEIKGLTSIVIEEKGLFSKFIQKLYEYSEESTDLKIFDKNYQCLKTSELLVVTDILTFDFNQATISKLITEDILQLIADEPQLKNQIEQSLLDATSLIEKKMLDLEINLTSKEMDVELFIKALSVKVETEGNSIFERVLDIIQVFKYLSKKRLLVFVNLGTFLTHREIEVVDEYVELQNLSVLLVDNGEVSSVKKQTIIDEDFVVLT